MAQATTLQQILDYYGVITGQRINLKKSSITFGSKVNLEVQRSIKILTGIQNEGGTGTYLGLPECFSGSKVQMLDYIFQRLKSKLSGWFERTLSLGGKEILLKAIAMALPVYAMTCFKLPKTTCEKITSAMSSFWWNSMENKKKIHWLSWGKLCLSKEQGGLGFRDLQCFNQALLAKQVWRILQNPTCLFARVMKSIYFEDTEILYATLGSRPSFVWRSILHGRQLLMQGLRKMIGNGQSSLVWVDPWLFDVSMRVPFMKNIFVNLNLRVTDLIDFPNRCWNLERLEDLFYPRDMNLILMNKPVVSKDDFWCWLHTRNGDYSVKSGYWLANRLHNSDLIAAAELRPSLNDLKVQVWFLHTTPKIKCFIWRALSGAIVVADKLELRGMSKDMRCQFCGCDKESTNHVLFSCSIARQVWALSDFPCPSGGFESHSEFSNFQYLLSMSTNQDIPEHIRRSFPWILWLLWKNRNGFFFEGKQMVLTDLVLKIKEEASEWFNAQITETKYASSRTFDRGKTVMKWRRPPSPWLKCNVGMAWSKGNNNGGFSWVLRDGNGTVLLHSRRSFVNIHSLVEAQFQSILWTIDSMISHKLNYVTFASEACQMVNAVNRPQEWPYLQFYSSEIRRKIESIAEWRIESEDNASNKGAFLIADSVIQGNRFQSYVAKGSPTWLQPFFDSESLQD